jgi:hypothetical protein
VIERPAPPPDVHEWVSFDEVDEQRTWVFDATFLRSNYTCIFGCGCKGILDDPAPELGLGCCNFGAHFVDDADVANLELHAERLEPRHMQFHAKAMKKGYLRPGDPDDEGQPTTVTRLVDHEGVAGCIFLNRPGFEGGAGCALHIAALEVGERPMDWKPSVCWQVPIRLEHSTDESGHLTSRLREWKRRDWGQGGSDFGWWCTEEPDAFVGAQALYISAKDDIVELVGARVYAQMVELLERREWVPLPHPAVRRR